MFQYKILINISYLNKQLFIFYKKDTKLCSYSRLQDETTNHIFVECKFAIKLWSDLRHYSQRSFDLPISNATFGLFEIAPDSVILLNYILLFYKYYIYSSIDFVFICSLMEKYFKVFDLEKNISSGNERKTKAFMKKWSKMMQLGNFMN